MQVRAFDGPLGAEILDADLRDLDGDAFERLYAAWLEHGVVRVRDQSHLDDAGLEAFSARFGPLEEIPVKLPPEAKARLASRYVTVISNIRLGGRAIGGLGSSEAAWHSDMTFVPEPPPASVLLAIEIPPAGGDTHFACQHAALEAVPPALRARIADTRVKHDASRTSVGSLRPGFEAIEDPRDTPGASHPIVLRHAETGRAALFLGRRDYAYVVGLALEESEALLDELWRYAALPHNVWTQKWRPGDLVIWDNRRVLHRRDAFDPEARRLLKRCQVLPRTGSKRRAARA